MKILPVPKRELNWCGTATRVWPISSKVALMITYEKTTPEKKVPANRDSR